MEVTPAGMLGRVSALQSMLIVSAIPLGSLVAGAAAEVLSTPVLFIAFGILLAMSAVSLLLSKTFRRSI
ncbi:hypothetical protein D3C76_1832210 [compost metagenome]